MSKKKKRVNIFVLSLSLIYPFSQRLFFFFSKSLTLITHTMRMILHSLYLYDFTKKKMEKKRRRRRGRRRRKKKTEKKKTEEETKKKNNNLFSFELSFQINNLVELRFLKIFYLKKKSSEVGILVSIII
jgi:hypothetical protein